MSVPEQGRQCMALSCDVSQKGQVAEAVRKAVEQFQHIDVLVNNAGVTKRIPTAEFRREDFKLLIQSTSSRQCYTPPKPG